MSTTVVSPTENAFEVWQAALEAKLAPKYVPKTMGVYGHCVDHVRRFGAIREVIIRVMPALAAVPEAKFKAAQWLHNVDRVPEFKKRIEELAAEWERDNRERYLEMPEQKLFKLAKREGLRIFCLNDFLADSPFLPDDRWDIANVVVDHPKFMDEPGDSPLLTLIRLCDKVDRMGPLGIMSSAAFQGLNKMAYDERKPFGFGSTDEDRMQTMYDDIFRIMEWMWMLPSDETRKAVNGEFFAFFVLYARVLGKEISVRTETVNTVEVDIRKALKEHYAEVNKAIKESCLLWAAECSHFE